MSGKAFKKALKPGGLKWFIRQGLGRPDAERAQKRQEEAIAKQQQVESAALAEATSEVAERKARAKRGTLGRGSLIATSPTGTNSTLGGG